jgi:hypothetical protein
MTVAIIQTADPVFYYSMLQETARTVRALCARNGYSYIQYVGIKRGYMPWQASYNRVFLLKEMVDQGHDGWVLYLDADAFIHDLEFDLSAYLDERSHAAAIFAGYGMSETSYDINSGGFAINLSHPLGKAIVLDWYRLIAEVPSEIFDGAVYWEHDLANDQHLLWQVLRRYVEDDGVGDHIIFERANQSYVNNGPFINQLLRSFYPSYAERLAAVKQRVNEIMRGRKAVYRIDEGPGIFMRAGHPKMMTACGRKTAAGILSLGKPGGLLFGPYIRLSAGRYIARIFGRVTPGDALVNFVSDVAIDRGRTVLGRCDRAVTEYLKGVISEIPFDIQEDTESLEVRVTIGPQTDMAIHGVQVALA